MTPIIFSDETPKGWIPPSIAAPFICIFLVAISMLPFDFGLEYLGFTDASGSLRGPLGFCLMLVSFIAMGLAVLGWVRWAEKRSLASVGLCGEQGLKKFLIGLAVGIAMMGAIVTAIALAGGYRVADLAPAFASPAALGWIALLLVGFIVQASVEEFVFRGWLFSTILRRWNTTAAFLLSSAAFTFLHFSPRTPLLVLVTIFVFAIFACAWVRRSNSIWGVMGWHTGWNWFGGTGFDVPITGLDSGLPALVVKLVPVGPSYLNGAGDGPEGSVFTLALLTVASLSFLLLARPRKRNEPLSSAHLVEHKTNNGKPMKLSGEFFDFRRLTVCALAALFIFYHIYTLCDLYLGSGTDIYDVGNSSAYDLYRHVQSILRVLIISSLLLVAMNWRLGLYGMWAAISALIATHYWAYFLDLPFRFLEGKHALSYLKGFIMPTIVTILFLSINSRRDSEKNAS